VPLTEIAYAKINLALHVRQRRPDGYHAIETLFAFVDDGDVLTVDMSDSGADMLTIEGDFADDLSSGPDNLVLRALSLARKQGGVIPSLAIALEKNLPVAAGLGGGSADAGALLRLVLRHWPGGIDPQALMAASVALGADVPACVDSVTAVASGIGDVLSAVPDSDVAGQGVLLVNPLDRVPTGPVFAAWDGVDRGPLPHGSPRQIARAGRNDLQPSAVALCPAIDDVMTVLRAQLPAIVRMSGSGATCFALFDSETALAAAAQRIADDYPDWWVLAGTLR
jgi:4-diphosphocytidyl-2-C-methyl-D-erythritol kinase